MEYGFIMSIKAVQNNNRVPLYVTDNRWGRFYFASKVVDATFNYYGIEREVKSIGHPPLEFEKYD